ncbi:hypothetical protein [Methylosinus sporium]|uniref:Uncharacterized protein n=2 Tax=Methylosinus sporium TaxID=428 RepID=A0A2U1SSQ9_METSR|nr:hypothetical protein [Methylosinus sporium]PWB94656.1 hypothetical protein C5689_06225 [Methylosinus sporium]
MRIELTAFEFTLLRRIDRVVLPILNKTKPSGNESAPDIVPINDTAGLKALFAGLKERARRD